MADLAIQATERLGQGRGYARKTRSAAKVPAVVYGRGRAATSLEVDAKELSKLIEHGAEGHLVTLNVDGVRQTVLVKEVQRDPLSGQLLHVDFNVVALDRKVHTVVTITVVGEHARTATERVLVHGARDITVECLPTHIPEHIEVNVENLEVGESIRANQLVLPAGINLVSDPETMVIAATAPRAAIEAEADAAAEPELVHAKKAEA